MNKNFECLVHVGLSTLDELPAPFLNRFEKYRLCVKDVLSLGWLQSPGLNIIMNKSRVETERMLRQFGRTNGRFGWLFQDRTVDSVFLAMLPSCTNSASERQLFRSTTNNFLEMTCEFVASYTSLHHIKSQLQHAVNVSHETLPDHEASVLRSCVDGTVDQQDLVDAFNDILQLESSETLPQVLSIVIRMTITRLALSALLQLAPPELVYLRRYEVYIRLGGPLTVFCDLYSTETFSRQSS